jgi:hypothetical protein
MNLDYPNGTLAIWSKGENDRINHLLSVKYMINKVET